VKVENIPTGNCGFCCGFHPIDRAGHVIRKVKRFTKRLANKAFGSSHLAAYQNRPAQENCRCACHGWSCRGGRGHEISEEDAFPIVDEPKMDPELCTSPLAMSPPESPTTGRDVFSFGACADQQEAFEDPEGRSVTSIIVDYLSDISARPTYADFMHHVAHELWAKTQRMHQYFEDLRKKRLEQEREGYCYRPLTSVQFGEEIFGSQVLAQKPVQEPQIGSQRKLNLKQELFEF